MDTVQSGPDHGTADNQTHPVLLYDGVCGLCDKLVQFTLPRDRRGVLRYAALQSDLGRAVLERHGKDPDDLDTLAVVVDRGTPKERLLVRSRAALFVASTFGGPWRLLGAFRIVPAFLLDLAYRGVAKIRYRLFGKLDACQLPRPEGRDRFLDAGPSDAA